MMLDANAWLGTWPFDDLEPDTSGELVAHQAACGINLSCVASLSAVFYQDPMPANRALLRETRDNITLDPVPILNPTLAHWPDALTFYTERHVCRQIRLVPNYHRYTLDDPRVDEVIGAAHESGTRVSIQVRLEDERAHHPLMQVPGVPVEELAGLARRWPDQRFLLLCCYLGEAFRLAANANLMFDLAHLEYLDTLNHVLAKVPAAQLAFGTHTPLFVTRAALAKLQQCTAGEEVVAAVSGGNLADWLSGRRDEVPWPERSLL